MLVSLIIYIVILIVVGIYTGIKENGYDSFMVAGRKQTRTMVLLSMMATMIGGSATFGVANTVMSVGFPAIWWLGVGSIGLLLQAFFVSVRVRELNAYTLADAGRITVGEGARIAICLIVGISWIGIVAGQFVALTQIFEVITGGNIKWLVAIVAMAVVAFTATGGQLSVMRTDAIQFFVLFFGMMAVFFFTNYRLDTTITSKDLYSKIAFFNDNFTLKDFFNTLLIVGSAYFIGPDVLSRVMAAKDGKTAKSAAIISSIVLVMFNFMIVLLALWCKENITDLRGLNPLIYLMKYKMPPILTFLLAIGLTSALLSSASTCLITTASLIQNDIIRKKNTKMLRIFILIIGLFATGVAIIKQDIISILLLSYSIYVPGVVCPLFIALLFYKTRKINQPLWLIGLILGGLCGIVNSMISFYWLPIIGMGVSLAFAFLSICFSKAKIYKEEL